MSNGNIAQSGVEVEAAISSFNHRYLTAINESDIEALASLTTKDHMMISSGGEPIIGKDALITAMTGAFERFDIDESWTPMQTVVAGDIAYQSGTFIVVAMPKAEGKTSTVNGKFVRVYRRQPDGQWFMVIDTHSTDSK